MKNTWKKGIILGIIALFISVSTVPAFSAVPKSTQENDMISIEYAAIDTNGLQRIETLDMSKDQAEALRMKLMDLLDLIRGKEDKNALLNLFQLFFNENDYPILSLLLGNALDLNILKDRNLVISQGWRYCLNPLKKMETDLMKPLTIWHYTDNSKLFAMPSSTTIVRFSPFETETYNGNQFGFMLRFKGLYITIPQKLPDQSFTFFIGFAKHVGAFEMPTLSLPNI